MGKNNIMKKKIIIIVISILLLITLYPAASYVYWFGRAIVDPMGALRIQEQFEKLPSEELLRKLHSIDPLSPYPGIAIDVLTKRKENKAIPYLIQLTKSKNQTRRAHAIRSLGEIGDKQAIPALFEILKTGEKTSQRDFRNALYALSRLGYEPVRPYVLKMLRAPDALNNGSLAMLRYIGKKEDLPILEDMFNKISTNDINARSYRGDIKEAIKAIQEREGE